MAHHLVAIIDSALGCEVVWCGWNVAVLWGKGSRVVEAVARWEVGVSHGRNRAEIQLQLPYDLLAFYSERLG